MRPVHQKNNPNKETLIYIPSSHVTVIRVYTTRIAKQYNELLISILLLLLVLPIYLGMCPSVPIHIHQYMSKLRLLLETDDEINGLCLQWIPYIRETTTQDVPVLIQNLPLGKQEVGLILCPFKNITGGRKSALPSDTWRPSGRSES